MIVEVLAVGTELLLGQIVNSNASVIGGRLADAGLDHFHQTVVGDNIERIAAAIDLAVSRADALIITGGIGPTKDDLTREALCLAAGVDMAFSDEYAEELRIRWEARGRKMPQSNLRQAQYPEGAEMIRNAKGTAPALAMRIGSADVFAVPGVPAEMIALLDGEVLPRLRAASGGGPAVLQSRLIRTWGRSESRVGDLLGDLFDEGTNPTLAFLASSGEIKVRITAKAATEDEAAALIEPVEAEVRRRLGPAVFGADDATIEQVLVAQLRQKGWTIATAESATGGMIASRLVGIAGVSSVFRGSVVAYHPDVKVSALGLDRADIDDEGEVSEDVALAMARGAATELGSDVAVAVTGSAGPEPLGKPAGTMVIAVHTPDGSRARTLRMPGDRERVRTYTTTAALHLLRLALSGEWWSDDPSSIWGVRPGDRDS